MNRRPLVVLDQTITDSEFRACSTDLQHVPAGKCQSVDLLLNLHMK